jgi:hypothetical protein
MHLDLIANLPTNPHHPSVCEAFGFLQTPTNLNLKITKIRNVDVYLKKLAGGEASIGSQ